MPINKFTTLLDLARQAKILSGETATFDGKIQVGIPFSGYPTGVDTGSTVSLGIVSSEDAVFSGNTGTTIFDVSNTGSTNYSPIFSGYTGSVWTNVLFSGNTSGLTLPITPLSADTQIVGPFWSLTQTGMTGDYVIGTQYTGYSITYSFFNVSQIGTGFTYSGFTTASQENFSAGTLDYKGALDYISTKEDASVEGRLITNKITITNGASASTIGYVLTQTGENGEGEWLPNSSADTNTYVTGGTLDGSYNLNLEWNTGGGANPISLSGLVDTFTGNTSGDCINDIYVKNIHSCSPLNINPNDEGNVYFGSTSGITIDVVNNRVGIGNSGSTPNVDLLIWNDVDGITGLNIKNVNDTNNSRSSLSVIGKDQTGADSGGGFVFFGPNYVPSGTVLGNYIPESLSIYTSGGALGDRPHINIATRRSDGEIRFFAGSGTLNDSSLKVNMGVNDTKMYHDLNITGNTNISGELTIETLGTGTSINNLGIDVNGNVVVGTAGGAIPESTTATTTNINFTGQTIYFDAVTPGTGNITNTLTGAKLGLIQKIYHNDGTEPTYPAGWVLMGDAIYFTSTLNIIYAEWAGGTRVEYWYVQEQ